MAAVLAEWIFFSLLLLCVQTCSAHVRRVSGLPLITVYLLAGALARVTGLLGREKPWGTASLHSGALGLISVAAGAELELESVRAQARVILCLTLSLTISALLIVGIARGGLICRCERRCEQTGWGCELPEKVRSAGALLSATVAVARSPSSAIALVQELGADGVFTQTLLGVTMVTDLLVVVLFAVTAEVVALTLPGEDAPPTSAGLSAPASPRKIDVATDTAVGGNAPLGRLANEGKRSATDVFTGGFGEESELQGLHEGAPPPHAMAIATPRELTDVVGERTTLQSSFAAFVVIARVVGHVLLQLVCSVALGAVVGWVVLCVARLPRSRHWKVVRSATRISVSHAAAWLANPPFLRLQCTFTHQLTIPTPLIPWKLRLLALLAVGSFAFNAEELATRVIRRFRGAEAEVAMPLVWEGDAAHRRLGSVPLIEPMLVCMVAGLLGRNFPHRLYNLPRIALHGLRFASAHALQRCGQRRAKRLSPAVIDGSKTSLLESALADGLPDASDIQTYGWSSGEGGRERRRHSTVNSAELTQLLHDAMPKVLLFFFFSTGGTMQLDALHHTWPAATMFTVVRLVSIWVGARVGSTWAGARENIRSLVWLGLVTQAGVSLGLADEIGDRFAPWAMSLQTSVSTCIVLNQLIGPPLLKMALRRSGDARAPFGSQVLGKRLAADASTDVTIEVSSAAAACGASGLADAYNKACSQLRESAIAIAALRGDKQTD